jgi:hypothetical protein
MADPLAGSSRRPTRTQITPPDLPDRWLHARREEALKRWGKRVLLLLLAVLVVLLVANWWIVEASLIGRDRAVAEACRDSPFASGAVTAAGGPEAVDRPDHPALQPYRADQQVRTDTAERIRDRAALLGDSELAAAATVVMANGPFPARGDIARVETRCRRYLDALGGT